MRDLTIILPNSPFSSQNNLASKRTDPHDAILKLVSDINSASKRKEHCCAIVLDVAKAFDTVDHAVLLEKLERYGIRGHILNWFQSYLCGRHQHVSINGSVRF